MKPQAPPVPAYDCAWPPGDEHAQAHITAGLPFLIEAIAYCRQRRRWWQVAASESDRVLVHA